MYERLLSSLPPKQRCFAGAMWTAYLALQANPRGDDGHLGTWAPGHLGSWATGYGSFATWNNARTVGMVALRVLPLLGPMGVATVAGVVVRAIILIANSKDPEESEVASTPPVGANSEKDRESTLRPGPNAGDSIPARGPGRDFTPEEREKINEIGNETGCHTCGSKNPGTKSGNFVPDHQPPNGLNPDGGPQRLYPQCLSCSRTQGGKVRGAGSGG